MPGASRLSQPALAIAPGGVVYSDASLPNGNTVGNTASETAFTSTYTFPAGTLRQGAVIRVELWGVYSTNVVAPTLTGKVKIAGATVLNTGALTTIAGVTNVGWSAVIKGIVASVGASGTINWQGYSQFATAATTGLSVNVSNTSSTATDTTTDLALTVTVQWSAANSSNTITLHQMDVTVQQPGTFSAAPQIPVGGLFLAIVGTNPATLLGYGTWSKLGSGRTLVTQDTGDTDFDTLEETGGSKTVTSTGSVSGHTHDFGTLAVANHASHTHTYTDVVNHLHTLATGTGSTGNFSQVIGTVDTSSGGTGGTPTQTALGTLSGNPTAGVATGTTAGPSATLTHTVSGATASTTPTYTGNATSVVQPYVVIVAWKRTA